MAGIYLCRGLKRPLLPACLAAARIRHALSPRRKPSLPPCCPCPLRPCRPRCPARVRMCMHPCLARPLPAGAWLCAHFVTTLPRPPVTAAAVPSLFLLGLLASLTQQLARSPFHLLCLHGA